MAKLTLSVNSTVIADAKRYAERNGTSLSKMVETYLTLASRPARPADEPQVLRSVRGILKKGDLKDYRRHLAEKYR